jgi:hypothetical protein
MVFYRVFYTTFYTPCKHQCFCSRGCLAGVLPPTPRNGIGSVYTDTNASGVPYRASALTCAHKTRLGSRLPVTNKRTAFPAQ